MLFAAFLSGGTALSYYVESLWFDSLGYGDVFWTNLNLRASVFAGVHGDHVPRAVRIVSAAEAGAPRRARGRDDHRQRAADPPAHRAGDSPCRAGALVRHRRGDRPRHERRLDDPRALLERRSGGLGAAQAAASQLDPIFGRPVSFYFFTLPAWRLVAGWLTTLAIIALLMAIGLAAVVGGTRLLEGRKRAQRAAPPRRVGGVRGGAAGVRACRCISAASGGSIRTT